MDGELVYGFRDEQDEGYFCVPCAEAIARSGGHEDVNDCFPQFITELTPGANVLRCLACLRALYWVAEEGLRK